MNKRLLIVDDVLFMRVNLRSIVEKFGYEVVGEAADGAEAITKYQYLNPDAILLDITYGAENFICKPFQEEKLKKVLDAVVPLSKIEPEEEKFNYQATIESLTIHHESLLTSVLNVKAKS